MKYPHDLFSSVGAITYFAFPAAYPYYSFSSMFPSFYLKENPSKTVKS